MYMLLSGTPPFTGSSTERILNKVETGVISFKGPKWKKISDEAKFLVKKMLTYDYKDRISAEKALNDPWFQLYSNNAIKDPKEIIDCISTLKEFQVTSAMKKAVLSFMASNITKKEEEKKLREIFKALDKDHNGTLSLKEITEGYKLFFNGNEELARAEAQKTINAVDHNKSGEVDYNGKLNKEIRVFDGKSEEDTLYGQREPKNGI